MVAFASLALTGMSLLTLSSAQDPSKLVGTWSTKSNKTLTGPDFYDSVNDKFIEPSHTGISYSFTANGFYEEAYYRAISNPVNPACPQGIMQWQHGTYTTNANGSISLTPFAVDGRQLLSNPCTAKTATYTRYNQTELFKSWEWLIDPYHNVPRLNLFKFDGSPMAPMYLAFQPPNMLPTSTLNPTSSATASAKATSKAKRGLPQDIPLKLNWETAGQEQGIVHRINAERLWWVGLAFTGVGGLLYFGPRRLGLRI